MSSWSSNKPHSDWLTVLRSRPEASSRLFCLPYAGAGASVFYRWPQLLPRPVDVLAVQLPGREERLLEPPFEHVADVIPTLGMAVEDWLDRPFALLGHSMGAILAFELCRYLQARGLPAARRLFVSGHGAPQLRNDLPPLHTLPDEQFVHCLQERYGGIPRAILETPGALEVFLPTLRADVTLMETYRFEDGPPLACPISALGGAQDVWSSRSVMAEWAMHTAADFELLVYEGGHFFITSAAREVVEDVSRHLV